MARLHSAAADEPRCSPDVGAEWPHHPLQQSQRAAGSLSALEAVAVGQISGESDSGGRVQLGIHCVVCQTLAMDRGLQEEEMWLSDTGGHWREQTGDHPKKKKFC